MCIAPLLHSIRHASSSELSLDEACWWRKMSNLTSIGVPRRHYCLSSSDTFDVKTICSLHVEMWSILQGLRQLCSFSLKQLCHRLWWSLMPGVVRGDTARDRRHRQSTFVVRAGIVRRPRLIHSKSGNSVASWTVRSKETVGLSKCHSLH